MQTRAMFTDAPARAGMYESFFLRAVCPEEPIGAWIRYTVRKPPRQPPSGSLWCTVFDARRERPFMHRLSTHELGTPAGGWIAVGGSEIGPGYARGDCEQARWSLRFADGQPQLRHLSPAWLYRAPLPRTKLSSPAPLASFDGTIELAGREAIELCGWPGMVGHNWGSEHAEQWIWLHAGAFEDAPGAWLDVALGRLRLAGRMTPWVANGALQLDGVRHRLGGLRARATQVAESPEGCSLELSGAGGLRLRASAVVPAQSAAGWRYADPDSEPPRGGEHDVVNCSIAAVELSLASVDGTRRSLRSEHGGAYELGMRSAQGTREPGHGVAWAPFAAG